MGPLGAVHRLLLPALGLGLVCLAAALWGSVGVVRGLAGGVSGLDPALVGLVRTLVGAACLLAVAVAFRVSDLEPGLPFRAILAFGLAGAVFQVSLFEAFARVGVTVTVVVTVCAPPLLVAAGEAVWQRRPPEAGVVAAMLAATSGVVLLCADGAAARRMSVDLTGGLVLGAASIAFAVVAVAARALSARLHPLRAAGFGLGSTALILAVVVAAAHGPAVADLTLLGPRDLVSLGYIGIAATGGAYLAFMLGMRCCASAGAGLAATMVEPLVAALLAAVLLNEHLGASACIGGLITLAALCILFRTQQRAGAAGAP